MNEYLSKEERELLPLISYYDDGIRYGRLLSVVDKNTSIVLHPNGTKTKVRTENITNVSGPYMDPGGAELARRARKKMGN